jgi:Cu2+-exporting ATPase
LGINTVKANCLGDSANSTANTKTKYIKELTRQGHKVAMVGDALNDLLAIKNSHLGIAVESNDSEQIIQQHAGAIITNRNNQLYLGSIVTALTIGNQTVRTIKQNLAFSLSYNMLALLALGGLLIGIGFVLNPAIGAALMVLQALFILANIYRFQQQKVKYANDAVLAETPTPEKKSSTPQIYQAFKISPQNSATLDKALLAKTPATAAPKPAPRVGKKYSYDDALHESSKGSVHVGLG